MSDEQESRPWVTAMEAFLSAGFSEDEVIPHSWFYEALDVEQPEGHTPMAVGERLKLKFTSRFEKLRYALISGHNIDLVSVHGQGYRWIPARKQAEQASADLVDGLHKTMRKCRTRIVCVDTSKLNDAERRQQADLHAHAAQMEAMMRGGLRKIRRHLRRGNQNEPPPAPQREPE